MEESFTSGPMCACACELAGQEASRFPIRLAHEET
jgi:hypothetical protein